MEASRLTIRGEQADRFAETIIDAKTRERKRSINKRGVRNIHKYQGDGFTQLTYERAAAHEDSWVMVSVLVEAVDTETRTVVAFVGGGGKGPFKLEEVSMRRVLRGEDAVGEAGRFGTVLKDIKRVIDDLELTVVTEWETDTEASMTAKIEQKIFDS